MLFTNAFLLFKSLQKVWLNLRKKYSHSECFTILRLIVLMNLSFWTLLFTSNFFFSSSKQTSTWCFRNAHFVRGSKLLWFIAENMGQVSFSENAKTTLKQICFPKEKKLGWFCFAKKIILPRGMPILEELKFNFLWATFYIFFSFSDKIFLFARLELTKEKFTSENEAHITVGHSF